MDIRLDYNLKHESIRDITPETLADLTGKTQSDHNRDNTIARNKLDSVERLGLNNKAKISELEKLTIKQQTEIDFIKNTPTNFDLADTELFTNRFGTLKSIIADGLPDAEILTDTFAPRSDGNFEFGLLKNPRSKPLSGVEKNVSLNTLFGQTVRGISYGESTNSLWIVTSDGQGARGYLFRCSPIFIDGQLNILSFWILDALGGFREFQSVAESLFNGAITLFVGVSDETGGGGHHLNRYRIRFDKTENIVTIADGKESSPGVPIYKAAGDILDGEVSSSDPDLLVEKVDFSEPGKLRGISVVNQFIYIVVQADTSASEEEIDSTGYSFIRRIKITSIGVLTSGANTFKFKLDDIFEDGLDSNSSPTHYDVYGIASYRLNQVQTLSSLTQDEIDAIFLASKESKLLYIAAKHSTTNKKKIVLINLLNTDVTDTGSPSYNEGLKNINTILQEVEGYSSDSTNPFIATMPDRTILEVEQVTSRRNMLAVHDLSGFDLFQGDIKYTAKVKRYFNTENFHAQLGVQIGAISVNQSQAITAGPDNNFSFVTTGGSRTRNALTTPPTFTSPANILHYHSFLSGEPFFVKPDFTFAITDGVSNPIGNINALTIKGSVNSGQTLYVSYTSGSTTVLAKVPFSSITAVSPNTGADGFTQYQIVTASPEPLTAGSLGRFAGPVSYDPLTSKLWVATNSGFIHNVTDGGSTLSFNLGNSYAVVKLYQPTTGSGTLTGGKPIDGSTIIGLSVYNNIAYVAMSVPNAASQSATNTIVRVFDITRSTSTQPLSISTFCMKGIVSDIDVSDKGLFSTDGKSVLSSVYNSQFYKNVFESTEVLDEFNFFKNPIVSASNSAALGFQVTASTFLEKVKTSNSFQSKEWILPRRAVAFGLYTDASLTLNPGKLQIIDFSDLDNPLLWAEFVMSNTTSKDITQIGLSGSLLYGSGQIDAMTFVDDKLFVGRRNSGFGTHINVIDFATNTATIVNAPFQGSGNIFSGMKFGYKNAETDRTGGLNERNNASFHYSGFVNANVKVGHTKINDMSAALITNKTDQNILTPFVVIGREYLNDLSGSVDVINGNTLESVIGIGPGNVVGQGSAKRVVMNSDGSALVGYASGIIAKIDDVRLLENDGDDYFTNFLAEKVKVWYPTEVAATGLTDMKIQHYIDVLGNHRNLVYVSYGTASGSPTLAAKFVFEDVASAGGALTTASEFLNNAEIVFFQNASTPGPVQSIDFMDNRIFLAINDIVNQFRLVTLKKFDVLPEKNVGYENNWFPVLGDNGFVDKVIDYDDLHYNGIKASINRLLAVSRMSLLFANTPNGSVMFKFPFVETSKWFSTTKTISSDINAVALSRDVFLEDGFVSEFIKRSDERIVFEGSWSDDVPAVTIPFTSSALFDVPVGGKQMRGKLLQQNGFPYPVDSYTNYKPFTVAPDNGFNIFFDGSPVSNFGYDFKSNVLMIDKDEALNMVQVIDLIDVSTTGASFKPVFASGSVVATVSLNEENSTLRFFQTKQDDFENLDGTYSERSYDLDITHTPVIQIRTLDGRPLATFQSAQGTGETTGQTESDLVKTDLASTEKVILDSDGNPVSILIVTGRKIKSEGKFAKRVVLRTFNFAISEEVK